MTRSAVAIRLGRKAKDVLKGRAGAVRIHNDPGNAAQTVKRQMWRKADGAVFFEGRSRG